MSGIPLELVITGGQVMLQQCEAYKGHRVPILNAHHVCPESWWLAAGKPVASPLRNLCPNCHSATHTAIDALLKNLDVSLLPPRCVALAKQAFTLAADNGLTPAPTL